MTYDMPGIAGTIFVVLLQLAFFVPLSLAIYGDLRRDRKKGPALAVFLVGLIGGMSVGLITALTADSGDYGDRCRAYFNSQLPDIFWVLANFIVSNLLKYGALGLIPVWLVARYWMWGIRADKTTAFIAGVLLGLAVWTLAELAHVRWGNVNSVNSSRLGLFALFGGVLGLVCRPLLFRQGRFQFGIKSLLAITAIWALLLGWLCPHFSRYQAEEEALASLATVLGKPVQCARGHIVGTNWAGFEYVKYVWLPRRTVADDQIDAIVAALARLPKLDSVDISAATISEPGKTRLENALPKMFFGTVGVSQDTEKLEIRPNAESVKDAAASR